MLRGYINRIYGGPDNVDWRQQDDYEREMQEVKDALEVIDRLESEPRIFTTTKDYHGRSQCPQKGCYTIDGGEEEFFIFEEDSEGYE